MLARGIWRPSSYGETSLGAPVNCSGRTVGARGDHASGHRLACPVNQARAFTGGSASIHCRTLFGDLQRDPRSTAHGAPLSLRAIVAPSGHGRIEVSMPPDMGDVLSIPCRWLLPILVPAHGHQHSPACEAGTLHRRRPDQLQVPAPSATDLARVFAVSLSHVAGCLQDDAPVRRASRLRTTSDGAPRCLRHRAH